MGNLQPIGAAERREAERRSAFEEYLCLVDLGDNRSAMLLDVSELGIAVQAVEGPCEGFSTTFRFQLPDTAILIEGEGEIAWADRAGRMGIRFTKLAEELKPEIRKWVTSEANPLFAAEPVTDVSADLDARDRVAQLEARIIVSGWAQIQALNFLVDQIAAMTQASGVAIAVEDGSGIVCKASSGIAPQVGVRVDPRSGLSWECVRTREVVNCVDTENDPRVDRMVCRQLNMRSAMLVPVKKDGRVAGLVEVFSSQPRAFSNQTVILLRRVAEAVASLDETALPDEAILQMPAPEPKAEVPAPTVRPKPVETLAKPPEPVPVVAKPVPPSAPAPPAAVLAKPPVPVPVVAKPAPAITPVTPKIIEKPAPIVAIPAAQAVPASATPAAVAPAPKPAIIAPPAPAPIKPPPQAVGVTTSFDAASILPPIAEPAPVKSVEKPVMPKSMEVAPAVAPPPLPKQGIAPEPPVANTQPEKMDKPAAGKIEIPLPPQPTVAPVKVLAKPAPIVAKPVEAHIPAQSAPLPAVAFSGAAAAAAAKPAPILEVPATKLEEKPAPTAEEMPELFLPEESYAEPGRRVRLFAGIAVVVLVAVLTYAGWHWTHLQPPSTSTNATTQPAATAPVAQAPNLSPPTAAPTGVAGIPAAVPSKPQTTKPASTTTLPPQPIATAPVVQPPVRQVVAPITAATFSNSGAPEPAPTAPPINITPPSTVGMANILAEPVAAPRLTAPVSQGVTGGKQIRRVQPVYPTAARSMRLSGTVAMVAHVAKDGSVTKVDIVKGHPMLNEAAADAVKRWKYEPFLLNGQPIETDINVQVRFDMPR